MNSKQHIIYFHIVLIVNHTYMYVHTHTITDRKNFQKRILKFSGKIFCFFIEKYFLGKKSANTNTITAGKFNIFNDDSPCAGHENSLALENVLMKNPCVFSLQTFATLFYGGNFITHICFFT